MRERRRPGRATALGLGLVLLTVMACDDAPVTPSPSTDETAVEDPAAGVPGPGPVVATPGTSHVPTAPAPGPAADPAAVAGLTELLDEAEALIEDVEQELAEDE